MTLQYEMTYYWPISLSSEVNRIIYNNQYRNVCEKKGRLDHVRFQNDLSLSNTTIFYIFVIILIWFHHFEFINRSILQLMMKKEPYNNDTKFILFLLHYKLHRFVVQNFSSEKTFENVSLAISCQMHMSK